MVPQLSALSLALCHEALEGGGNHKMVTIISQKETSPLAHFVRNSLPHKSFRFCSPMRKQRNQQMGTNKWEPSNRKKKLPLLLTSFAIHCLTKASAFVPQCENTGTSKWEPTNGNRQIAKRNFPSCSLCSQFTASQKLPLLFPNAKTTEPANGNQQMGTVKSQKETSPLAHFVRNSLPHKSFCFCSPMRKHRNQQMGTNKWEPSNRKKKLPLLLTLFAIHCLTKASAFVPQCKNNGTSKWEPTNGNRQIAKRNFPSCSLRSQFTASQKLPLLFPNPKTTEPANGNQQMGTIKSQKETSPLAHFVRNSLPHKSFRFCSPIRKQRNQQMGTNKWEPSNRKKKLPLLLTSFAIHCLTKASAFVPQCENNGTIH